MKQLMKIKKTIEDYKYKEKYIEEIIEYLENEINNNITIIEKKIHQKKTTSKSKQN